MRALFAMLLLALGPGCFFSPGIEDAGYAACESVADCAVGRYCSSGYCVPPPWHDESYGQRRLLVIENQREVSLYEGNAVVFWVGESGTALSLDDVTSDTRYLYFDFDKETWEVLPVYFDVFDDLINGSIQYLVSRDDIRRFRIEAPTKLDEDERCKFSAQVYDASLKPSTEED